MSPKFMPVWYCCFCQSETKGASHTNTELLVDMVCNMNVKKYIKSWGISNGEVSSSAVMIGFSVLFFSDIPKHLLDLFFVRNEEIQTYLETSGSSGNIFSSEEFLLVKTLFLINIFVLNFRSRLSTKDFLALFFSTYILIFIKSFFCALAVVTPFLFSAFYFWGRLAVELGWIAYPLSFNFLYYYFFMKYCHNISRKLNIP